MGVLTQKFVFTTALVIGLGGVGGEVYTSREKGTTLAEDYGRAAQCEQKLFSKATCTDNEQTSVIKKSANEEIRKYSHGAMAAGVILGVLSIL